MTKLVDKQAVELQIDAPDADGTMNVRVRGRLDTDTSPVLADALDGWRSSGTRQLKLDLRSVSFMSSCGVGTLVAAVADFRDDGGDIVIVGANSALMAVFRALDLLDFLTVAEAD